MNDMLEHPDDDVINANDLVDDPHASLPRRAILKALTALGVGTADIPPRLAAQAAQGLAVTPDMIKQAEWIAGLDLTEEERTSTARSVQRTLQSFAELRKFPVGYDVSPALTFFPTPPRPATGVRRNQAVPIEIHTGQPSRIRGGARLYAGHGASALIRSRAVELDRADQAVSGAAEAFRPALEVRGDLHRGPGAEAGGASRPGDRRRNLSWAIARHSLGCQGPDCLSRIPDDLGCDAVQGSGD